MDLRIEVIGTNAEDLWNQALAEARHFFGTTTDGKPVSISLTADDAREHNTTRDGANNIISRTYRGWFTASAEAGLEKGSNNAHQ